MTRERIIAQQGESCFLTGEGFIALMESPKFLPVRLAGWEPESEHVVGYINGDTVYRVVDETVWLAVLKECRQRTLDSILENLRKRGMCLQPDDNIPTL